MDYLKLYNDICNNPSSANNAESHHKHPRCLGGSDDAENLVMLSPRVHFLAHRLLAKLYPSSHGLTLSAFLMSHKLGVRISSRSFEMLRDNHRAALRDMVRTEQHKNNIANALRGKCLSEITRKKISEKRKGRKLSEEHKNKIRAALKLLYLNNTRKGPMTDREHTKETKQRLSQAGQGKISPFSDPATAAKARATIKANQLAGKPRKSRRTSTDEEKQVQREKALIRNAVRYQCPHCEKAGPKANMAQHHFDRCKFKPIFPL